MKSTGATIAVTGRGDRFSAWFLHHRVVLVRTFSDLLENPVSSLMTWFVIGIALALPAILYVMLENVSRV
ncbi:MAG: cell division protein, partial [Gammaproteobacteria bacterium]|nr:cell division protein [Gammaproteobacteria bacterium]